MSQTPTIQQRAFVIGASGFLASTVGGIEQTVLDIGGPYPNDAVVHREYHQYRDNTGPVVDRIVQRNPEVTIVFCHSWGCGVFLLDLAAMLAIAGRKIDLVILIDPVQHNLTDPGNALDMFPVPNNCVDVILTRTMNFKALLPKGHDTDCPRVSYRIIIGTDLPEVNNDVLMNDNNPKIDHCNIDSYWRTSDLVIGACERLIG